MIYGTDHPYGEFITKESVNNVVLENLEKTGIPIKYYDKYGNASEKPESNKPIPKNVNIKTVLIDTIRGKDYYVTKVSDKKTLFFDADSGLKTKEMEVTNMNGQEIISTTTLDNFKEVGGVKFPFMISQSFGP